MYKDFSGTRLKEENSRATGCSFWQNEVCCNGMVHSSILEIFSKRKFW